MAENADNENIQRLRRYVTDLEAENALLRGQAVPSASAVELQNRNAELRRQIAAAGEGEAAPQAGRGGAGEYLTVAQAAGILNVSSWQVLRELRESLPLTVDNAGRTVVSRGDLDKYLRARAQGRPTGRFL